MSDPGSVVAAAPRGSANAPLGHRAQHVSRTSADLVPGRSASLALCGAHARSPHHHELDIIIFCCIVPSIILHEISHGAVALAFGDDTAKRAGRLTLNPIAHVDPIGTLLVPA